MTSFVVIYFSNKTVFNKIMIMIGLKVKRYTSQRKAAVTLDIPHHQIFLCCRNLRAEAGGFGWQYAPENKHNAAEDIDENKERDSDVEIIEKRDDTDQHKSNPSHNVGNRALIAARLREYAKNKAKKNDIQTKTQRKSAPQPVIAINLKSGLQEKRYSSQNKATLELRISKRHISECCQGIRAEAGGFGWQYAPENKLNTAEVEDIDANEERDSDVEIIEKRDDTDQYKKNNNINIHGVGDRDLIAARLREYAKNKVTNKENRWKGLSKNTINQVAQSTSKKGCGGQPVYSINLTTGLLKLFIKSH
jgi:hypothetical protein